MSFCPSTMATRSSSACVALNNMRFINFPARHSRRGWPAFSGQRHLISPLQAGNGPAQRPAEDGPGQAIRAHRPCRHGRTCVPDRKYQCTVQQVFDSPSGGHSPKEVFTKEQYGMRSADFPVFAVPKRCGISPVDSGQSFQWAHPDNKVSTRGRHEITFLGNRVGSNFAAWFSGGLGRRKTEFW